MKDNKPSARESAKDAIEGVRYEEFFREELDSILSDFKRETVERCWEALKENLQRTPGISTTTEETWRFAVRACMARLKKLLEDEA